MTNAYTADAAEVAARLLSDPDVGCTRCRATGSRSVRFYSAADRRCTCVYGDALRVEPAAWEAAVAWVVAVAAVERRAARRARRAARVAS